MTQSQSLSVLPYFDANHYTYWKVCMRAFLKSLDEHVWTTSIEKGWKRPATPIDTWSKDEMNEFIGRDRETQVVSRK
jgi:hypothetical protein